MSLIFIQAEWVNNITTSEWPHFTPGRNYSPGHEDVEGEHQWEKVALEPSRAVPGCHIHGEQWQRGGSSWFSSGPDCSLVSKPTGIP